MDFNQALPLIQLALNEDFGDGDHSARACLDPTALAKARIVAKEAGVVAGIGLAQLIFHEVDPRIQVTFQVEEGTSVVPGMVVLRMEGPAVSLLGAERTALNFMQRLSGIATTTARYVALVAGTGVKLLDTRKTTPGFRALEKWAVTVGGGHNHRMGLYDMVMLKDNHIDFAGGIPQAVDRTRNYLKNTGKNLKIEVETRNLAEVKQALEAGVDRIMLDNFTPEVTRTAVALIQNQTEIESSGGITAQNLLEYAQTGVHFISLGALTHSVKSLDLSMLSE
jgi:nicotinate-nucleotide pyrophosphorylase (carboxylating)